MSLARLIGTSEKIFASLLGHFALHFEQSLPELGVLITKALRKTVTAAFSLKMEKATEIAASAEHCALLVELHCQGKWIGNLAFGPDFLFGLVELMFGAEMVTTHLARSHRITELEVITIRPFLEQLVDLLQKHLCPEQAIDFVPLLHFSQPLQSAHSNTLHTQFYNAQNSQEYFFSLLLGEQACIDLSVADEKNNKTLASQTLQNNLQSTSVELTALLGQSEMSLQQLMALKQDDVIWLNHFKTDPIPVFVEEILIFYGMPQLYQNYFRLRVEEKVI